MKLIRLTLLSLEAIFDVYQERSVVVLLSVAHRICRLNAIDQKRDALLTLMKGECQKYLQNSALA